MSDFLDPATLAMKNKSRWFSPRLGQDVDVVRWGSFGTPLLLFPTAGGDAEEVERFYLVKVLEPFILAGRLKVYSVDSINGRTWLTSTDIAHSVWIHRQYGEFVRQELVPLIRTDCRTESIEVLVAGASIGALNALNSICRHPDIFRAAICMSGTYDLQHWLKGQWFDDFYYHSPLMFVPGLSEGTQLERLRSRMVWLPTGGGDYENPGESWNAARVLGARQVPNRVDVWDGSWPHDWVTWREMLPRYVEEALAV